MKYENINNEREAFKNEFGPLLSGDAIAARWEGLLYLREGDTLVCMADGEAKGAPFFFGGSEDLQTLRKHVNGKVRQYAGLEEYL